MDVDRIRLAYAYNKWANARAVASAAALTPEQLQRDLGNSHGSVFGTLTHILWGEWRWLSRWMAPLAVPGTDPLTCKDLSALQRRWAEIEALQTDFLSQVTDSDLARLITYENPPGTPWTYSLDQMLQHVVNHSTYHRGQITTLLRQLEATAPPTDFLVFIDELRDATAEIARGSA